MEWLMEFLEILGTAAFAISGAVEAMKKEMDILGVLVLGLVTAVGGGIIRDLIIGRIPPATFQDPKCAKIALAAALATFVVGAFYVRYLKRTNHRVWNLTLLVSDALGLGVFTVLGIRSAQEQLGTSNTALLLFVGVVTGVGGGLMRDVFAGNIPYIFRKHIYATVSIGGAVSYLVLERMGYEEAAVLFSIVFVLVVRVLAAHYQWNLPRVRLDSENQQK